MIDRRRFIAFSLLSCVFGFAVAPTTANAGPLLDWLFQRNRSQGLASVGSGYGQNAAAAYAQSGYGAAGSRAPAFASQAGLGSGLAGANTLRAQTPSRGFGSCLKNCPLFSPRSSRSAYASNRSQPGAGALAAASQNPTTAGYGGGSCGPGWCQQTVLKYVPQIAYRTAYQPVPVTTYKTTTSINPQNGLPRTCTRPCTSYSYQARRVPYTTYKPVYTTVPVSDDMGRGQPTTAFQPAANTAPSLPPANYGNPGFAYQPPAGGCSTCQNNAAAAPSSAWGAQPFSGTPGYTPGNSGFLPPAPAGQVGPWSSQPMAPPTGYASPYGVNPNAYGQTGQGYDPPGATEWRPVAPGARGPAGGGTSPWESTGRYRNGNEPATPADRAPSLRPSYDDREYRFSNNDFDDSPRYLKPIPMTGEPRSINRSNRRIDGGDADQTYYRKPTPPARNTAPQELYRNNAPYGDEYASDDRLFGTPNRSSVPTDYRRPATIDPPSNQGTIDFNETRRRSFDSRAVRDLDRERRAREQQNWPENDNTARRKPPETSETGVRPLHDEEQASATRYAAVPIDWSNNDSSSAVDRRDDRRPTSSSQRRSGWRPIR